MMSDTLSKALGTPGPGRAGQASHQTLTGRERLLWEASERALRQPGDWLVVVLHLSRLSPPAPRPHHIRVARVLMQDAASRFGGQVFGMRNQDLVLLCARAQAGQDGVRHPPGWRGADRDGRSRPPIGRDEVIPTAETLPDTLAKLFAADFGDPGRLTSLWRLDRDTKSLFGYLAGRAETPDPNPDDGDAAEENPSYGVPGLTALQEILSRAPLAELLVQQTGMSLGPDRGKPLADRLAPAFRELELSFAALNLRPLVAQVTRDPFLLRHLASGLDMRLIQLLADDLAAGGRLTRVAVEARLPIHIDLGLEAILSPAFARLSRQASASGVRLGAAVSVMQACADLDLMEHARQVIRLTGGELVLTRVDAAALGLITPALLQPDLVKLMWSPILLDDGRLGSGRIEPTPAGRGSLAGMDPSRIVLQGADSPTALAWGQAHGISLFQGSFLDQVQAATRMGRCHSAGGCTLRQCGDRASAVAGLGRAGCGNPALLDAGFGFRP